MTPFVKNIVHSLKYVRRYFCLFLHMFVFEEERGTQTYRAELQFSLQIPVMVETRPDLKLGVGILSTQLLGCHLLPSKTHITKKLKLGAELGLVPHVGTGQHLNQPIQIPPLTTIHTHAHDTLKSSDRMKLKVNMVQYSLKCMHGYIIIHLFHELLGGCV